MDEKKAERKAALLRTIGMADAYGEINNAIGRASVAYMFHQADALKELFSFEEESELCFPGTEKAGGAEAVARAIDSLVGAPLRAGEMTDCHLCSPHVEFVSDTFSAVCSWEVLSAIAEPTPGGEEPAKAVWAFGTLDALFVLREKGWLIQKISYRRKVRCDYDRGWAEEVSA